MKRAKLGINTENFPLLYFSKLCLKIEVKIIALSYVVHKVDKKYLR